MSSKPSLPTWAGECASRCAALSGLFILAFIPLLPLHLPAGEDVATPPGEQGQISISPGAIPWIATLKEAKALSEESGKPLLMDFGADWCGFCKKLDRETFGDERVIRLVRDSFVPLRVDTQKDPATAKEHAVTGLPTVIFATPQGEELHRIVGFVPPDDFLQRASKFAVASQAIEELKLAAEKDPSNVDAQRAYARALFAAGKYDGARQVLEKALASSADEPRVKAAILLDLGDALRLGGKQAEACEAYRKLIAMGHDSGGEERRKALLPFAHLLVSRKSFDDALSALDDAVGNAAVSAADRLEALFLRGYVHAVRKDVPKALSDLKAAREADPDGRWGLRAGWILDIVESR